MAAGVVQGSPELLSPSAEPQRGKKGVIKDPLQLHVHRALPLPHGTQTPGCIHQAPEGRSWHEVSLEIILVAPPVLRVRCGSDVSCRPQCRPEYQRLRGAQRSGTPHPRETSERPFPMPWPSLSQLLPPLFGGPCPSRTPSLPLLPTRSPGSPNTEAAGH